MLFSRRATRLVSIAVLLTILTGCATSPNSKKLEQILAAEPRVRENPELSSATVKRLPADFPEEIPLYPNAQFQAVTQPTTQTASNGDAIATTPQSITRWVTSDPSNLVQNFYQNQFQDNNWEILNQSPPQSQPATFEARRNDLQVEVSIYPTTINTDASTTPSPSPTSIENQTVGTQVVIQYSRNPTQTAQNPTEAQTPQAGEPGFIGPSPPSQTLTQLGQTPDSNLQTTDTNNLFTDLDQAPPDLRRYIEDLVALDILPFEQTNSKNNLATTTQFNPNKTINRREFARWLFAANNQLYVNRPSQQIREASATTQPVFQDVPPTDPDFSIIQGLAEAGIIPSSLSGDGTAVLFRPDAPVTREQLALWKVPLDTRQALPNASVDAVKQTWGFQDAPRIEPRALRAVLADFQNSEQSNIRRAFGYTTLFQPKKPVTRAEAAATLWYFGSAGEGMSAQEALQLKRQLNQPAGTPQPSATPTPSPSIPVS